MRIVKQGFIAVMLMPVLVAGCATQEVKVSCDGKLQPINPPRDSRVVQLTPGAAANGSGQKVVP
jgi:hypothetical protein